MQNQELRSSRREYTKGELLENEVPANPMDLFSDWWKEWESLGRPDTTAMTVSTTGADGIPDARIVLLKGIENGAFTFFTNYKSKKGSDIEANPMVHILFFWAEQERQVRVVGHATKLSFEKNQSYFKERPVGSQIGAISSPQSSVIVNREVLESEVEANNAKYGELGPDCPEHWGGYAVEPFQIEFWQGRASRLHDRLRYKKSHSSWSVERLAP
ncbi:MAG: pyridoxamine 5'-phosphate oxidase [Flavobacteriia bacterium]|nr:pyridoxamine 5'-phosphate oxidase [Flavobacteriia bacterium]